MKVTNQLFTSFLLLNKVTILITYNANLMEQVFSQFWRELRLIERIVRSEHIKLINLVLWQLVG